MTTYRLGSAPMVYTPGLIAWAINGASFKKDRPAMIKLVAETWSIPRPAARKLLTREAPYTIEGETVVFDA